MLAGFSKRPKRFSQGEKELLTCLIEDRFSVIENKKTDSKSTARKNKAWAEITHEFNSSFEVIKSTEKQLRKCWQNMKARIKKDATLEGPLMLTAGRGPLHVKASDISEPINYMLSKQYKPLWNDFVDEQMHQYQSETNVPSTSGSDTVSSMGESTLENTQRKRKKKTSKEKVNELISSATEVEHSLKIKKLKLEIDFIQQQNEILQMQRKLLNEQQEFVKKQQELLLIEHNAKFTKESAEGKNVS